MSGPTAPPPRALLPPPSLRLLARLLAAFALSLAFWFAVRQPYSRLIVWTGAQILSAFSGTPAADMISEEDNRFRLHTGLESGGKPLIVDLQVYPVSWNLTFLVALALMTPLSRWKSCWPWALLAGALLAVSHVGYFSLATYCQIAALYQSRGIAFESPELTNFLGLLMRGYSLTIAFFLPFLLYAPVFILRDRLPFPRFAFFRRQTPRRAAPPGGRNSPCPCGSGRKYKACCGR